MKMITDSLEKVYTAMGGADDFDKTDIANGIEQISEVAGGGGATPMFIQFNPGGFVKSIVDGVATYYTYAEMLELVRTKYLVGVSPMSCPALSLISLKQTGGELCVCANANTIDGYGETEAYLTQFSVVLKPDDTVSGEQHAWYFTVTNDD